MYLIIRNACIESRKNTSDIDKIDKGVDMVCRYDVWIVQCSEKNVYERRKDR